MDLLGMKYTSDHPESIYGNYGDKIYFMEIAIKNCETLEVEPYFFYAYWKMLETKVEHRAIDLSPYADNEWREEIFEYMQYAAEEGYVLAQEVLSEFYRNGWFTPINFVQADFWADQAANNPYALSQLEDLPYEMNIELRYQ